MGLILILKDMGILMSVFLSLFSIRHDIIRPQRFVKMNAGLMFEKKFLWFVWDNFYDFFQFDFIGVRISQALSARDLDFAYFQFRMRNNLELRRPQGTFQFDPLVLFCLKHVSLIKARINTFQSKKKKSNKILSHKYLHFNCYFCT